MNTQPVIRIRARPEPLFWYGHFGMDMSHKDARFFVVAPVPKPRDHLVVLNNVAMMGTEFGFDLDKSPYSVTDKIDPTLADPNIRMGYACMDLAVHLGAKDRYDIPIIVLGVPAEDAMFLGSYIGFLKMAGRRLADAMDESPYFNDYAPGLIEALNQTFFKCTDNPKDTGWLHTWPYEASFSDLLVK